MAGALDQRLGEIEGKTGILDNRGLDALHLLLDLSETVCDRIARAMHDEGSGGGVSHQTVLSMNRFASFTRSSPEMSLGSSVSRRAASVQDCSWFASCLVQHG
jgi:hypothetical protein